MATITVPDCPVCEKPMLPNTAGKQRNPKAPDWKCSDQNCKRQYDKATGNWVVSEYITSKWDDTPQNATTGQNRPPGGYQKQPPKDFKTTMDYKNASIGKFQDSKEESMRLFSSGRDAVLLVTSQVKGELTEDQMKEKIKEWRNWFYQKIYKMSEEEYKELNSPF